MLLPLAFTGLTLAALTQVGPQVPPGPSLRLPPTRPPVQTPSQAPSQSGPERIAIDLGPDAPTAAPPDTIDILAPLPTSEAANAAMLKECEDQREAGIVAGEIVVCREGNADTSQLYSGTREAWLKAYAQRTQNAGTLPPPDVAGEGIFRGPATVSGLCVIGPCPDEPAMIVDVEAIPPPPDGSDAQRVAQGLTPLEPDSTPLSEEDRRRVEAELGLPPAPQPQTEPQTQSQPAPSADS